jgi:phosphatidylserine decarboxylase
MTIHKEGHRIIFISVIALALLFFLMRLSFPVHATWHILVYVALFMLLVWIISFFRSPVRKIVPDQESVISPADGRVVVVEECVEKEYLKQPMRQVSVFMSPLNVHLNRYPSDATVTYVRHHPGKYLVAWHPKSSELNERSSQVLKLKDGQQFMLRQVAGALARRIVCYSRPDQKVQQGDEMGFIKFGSRLDLYIPLHWEVKVKNGDKVKGGITCIARITSEPKAS